MDNEHCHRPLRRSFQPSHCVGWSAHQTENQQWKLIKLKDGEQGQPLFRIQNVRAPSRAMDLYNGRSSDNTEITGWSHDSTTNDHQLWYVQGHGNVVKIESYATGTFVDLYHGDSENG
ncbi:hypothetical protein QQZ08_011999 [Neonectria magnoliae]|uniref:Ricin B lectin domain-containing protein n=1 Tax=Neonectria magnoliae TaxID=2732573 RepID=A0ABR1H6F2_9HYPO